jgi:hypothetical protein
VRTQDASVKEANLFLGCLDACLMHFDGVETMAVGNLFLQLIGLELAADSTAPFFWTVSPSPEAWGTKELGRLSLSEPDNHDYTDESSKFASI